MASEPKVSEILFDLLQLEIINHIKGQHELQPYLDSGLDPHQAHDIIQRLICDKLMSMGESVGKRLAFKLLDNDPKSLLQSGENSPYRFISRELWMFLFNKPADYCSLAPGEKNTYILRENSLRWVQRFSPTQETLNDLIRPYAWFAGGIIRGALTTMGLNVEVCEEVELRKEQVYILFKIEEIQTQIKSL